MLCAVYGLEPAQVRVIVPDVGGGFGVKSRTYPEEAVLGFYARQLGRPVRWTETRSENFLSMPQGRGQVQYATIGGTRDGRITAYQLDVVAGRRRLPADRLGAARHDDAHDVRRLRHRQRRLHRGVDGDEHAVDHRLPRRRPTRGGGGDRAHGRPVRGRDRDRPGGGAPSQHDPEVPRGAHDRRRHAVRRRRLPAIARAGARGCRLRRSCAPSRRPAAHPVHPCSSGSASAPTSRSRRASAGRSSAPSSCSPTAA